MECVQSLVCILPVQLCAFPVPFTHLRCAVPYSTEELELSGSLPFMRSCLIMQIKEGVHAAYPQCLREWRSHLSKCQAQPYRAA